MAIDKLRAITYFVRTVEAGSFAAAARALGVAPSALSKALTALEEDLGFTLFIRSTRKLALTDDGGVYHASCRDALQKLEIAEVAGRRGVTAVGGTLRVGIHPALRVAVFGELHRFFANHPDLRLEISTTNAPSSVLNLGLDVVLHIGRLEDSGLVAHPLGWADLVVCGSPTYLQTRGLPEHPRDLTHHDVIVYARPDSDPHWIWEFSRGGISHTATFKSRLVVRDGIGAIPAAVHHCGLARPYAIAARGALKAGQLRVVLSDWSSRPRPIYAVFAKSEHVPAKVRAFIDFASRAVL
jgi:DNA-binding transcriptional LysR family regulator